MIVRLVRARSGRSRGFQFREQFRSEYTPNVTFADAHARAASDYKAADCICALEPVATLVLNSWVYAPYLANRYRGRLVLTVRVFSGRIFPPW